MKNLIYIHTYIYNFEKAKRKPCFPKANSLDCLDGGPQGPFYLNLWPPGHIVERVGIVLIGGSVVWVGSAIINAARSFNDDAVAATKVKLFAAPVRGSRALIYDTTSAHTGMQTHKHH